MHSNFSFPSYLNLIPMYKHFVCDRIAWTHENMDFIKFSELKKNIFWKPIVVGGIYSTPNEICPNIISHFTILLLCVTIAFWWWIHSAHILKISLEILLCLKFNKVYLIYPPRVDIWDEEHSRLRNISKINNI